LLRCNSLWVKKNNDIEKTPNITTANVITVIWELSPVTLFIK
jgi:hypothetical protein